MDLPTIVELESVDSTNEHAFRELAGRHAEHLSAWVAAEQTAGRGRRGASWFSTPGDSLMMSLTLVGRDSWSLPTPAVLSMTIGVALVSALERLGLAPDRVALDWPNDLVASAPGLCSQGGYSSDQGAELPKLAGILIEARDFDPDAPQFVCGIGVNLGGTLPAELRAERPVATLHDLGLETTPIALARALQHELAEWLETGATAPDQLCQEYTELTGLAGATVDVELAGGTATGTLVLIEPSGIAILNEDSELLRFPLEHVQALRGHHN
jgi:BirA family biotin operon repressor/biotin-[acetyl-CoA-carboxylase] ligase